MKNIPVKHMCSCNSPATGSAQKSLFIQWKDWQTLCSTVAPSITCDKCGAVLTPAKKIVTILGAVESLGWTCGVVLIVFSFHLFGLTLWGILVGLLANSLTDFVFRQINGVLLFFSIWEPEPEYFDGTTHMDHVRQWKKRGSHICTLLLLCLYGFALLVTLFL